MVNNIDLRVCSVGLSALNILKGNLHFSKSGLRSMYSLSFSRLCLRNGSDQHERQFPMKGVDFGLFSITDRKNKLDNFPENYDAIL